MYLIPFAQHPKSYTVPPEEDHTANHEFKKWLSEKIERRKLLDKIHEETLNEVGETFQ